jgi:DNA replication protein DnaC
MGKPGRGKTHLAVAIAYRAIQNGFDAFFTTAATLIDDLSAAFRTGQLADALPTYTHPAVLVVNEVGYLTYGRSWSFTDCMKSVELTHYRTI